MTQQCDNDQCGVKRGPCSALCAGIVQQQQSVEHYTSRGSQFLSVLLISAKPLMRLISGFFLNSC